MSRKRKPQRAPKRNPSLPNAALLERELSLRSAVLYRNLHKTLEVATPILSDPQKIAILSLLETLSVLDAQQQATEDQIVLVHRWIKDLAGLQ